MWLLLQPVWSQTEGFERSASSPESEEQSWLYPIGSGSSLAVKATNSRSQCCCHGWPTVICHGLLSGMTSERLMALRSRAPSNASLRHHLAKTFRSLDLEEAWMESAASWSSKCFDSSVRFSHPSSSSKTSQDSEAPPPLSSVSFPRWGMTRGGRMYQRSNQAPRIGVKGGGAWLPTPTASDYGSSQNGVNSSRPSAGTPSLSTLARQGKLLPTPTPTPTASDAKRAGRRALPGTRAHKGETLTDVLCRKPASGNETLHLNPQFVEWMQAFPTDWTMPNESIVRAVSELSAMHGASTAPNSPSTNCLTSEVPND